MALALTQVIHMHINTSTHQRPVVHRRECQSIVRDLVQNGALYCVL